MQLQRFRVSNFRSVQDSGWIEVTEVTALIGTNESGKTNLLVPLWKLNPAGTEGAIDLLSDAPRKRYNELRSGDKKVTFVEAQFALSDYLTAEIARRTGATPEDVRSVRVARRFDGTYTVEFPDDKPVRTLPSEPIVQLLQSAKTEIAALSALKTEEALKAQILSALDEALSKAPANAGASLPVIKAVASALDLSVEGAPK
ncbi:MAG: AAA family ATPase, partial [Gemmatimonadales bacterium]